MLDPTLPERLVAKGDKLCYDALAYIDGMWEVQRMLTGALDMRNAELLAARERIKHLTARLETRPHHVDPAKIPVRYHSAPLPGGQTWLRG